MNSNHLPAGQPMPGGVGGAASGHGLNGGRRRPPPAYSAPPAHHQHHQHHHPALAYPYSHMNPYANNYYPPPLAHHYPTNHGPSTPYSHVPSYVPYPQQPQRSPPPVHQTYPPIVSSSMQYTRPPPQQPSPALSTPPPFRAGMPPPAPIIPQTPTSTHSSQAAAATSLSPEGPQPQEPPVTAAAPRSPEAEVPRAPAFRFPLPWFSHPDEPFPRPSSTSKRRRPKMSVTSSVELPTTKQNLIKPEEDAKIPSSDSDSTDAPSELTPDHSSPADVSSRSLAESQSPERDAQSIATPVAPKVVASVPTSTAFDKSIPRTAVPAVPVVPVVPKTYPRDPTNSLNSSETPTTQSLELPTSNPQLPTQVVQAVPETRSTSISPAKPVPKLWSNLFQNSNPSITSSNASNNSGAGTAGSGAPPADAASVTVGISGPGSFAKSNANSLAEALRDYQVSNSHKIAFIEPRGLVNTGNMCYMNSVLQALIFCTPFYNFLDQVSKAATYSFNSETPLIDAMVMFLREYKVIDSASSEDQLRRRLKSEELEQYGDAFTPEFVYDAMKQLPRFASMQRGHQQDAEEFLGFLLQALGDECTQVTRHHHESSTAATSAAASTGASSPTNTAGENEWLEVGRKQRAAVTRSSGEPAASSPIGKIFSGQLRSVLRVPGQKESVTCESYQPLQLDIGDAHVNNIVDALKHLTRPEKLTGDFAVAPQDTKPITKQVLIESVPPVLILHLKRFKYDPADNSTAKVWTKIDYPLELELPKEMFSPIRRIALQNEGAGAPKYRLTAAIYHHGKSASGGHYTVDLRRQDGREWIRVDDTVIRRIRSEDVVESSANGSTTKSTTWVDQKYSVIGPTTGNRFEGIGHEDGVDDDGWNRVGSAGNGTKKWSSVVVPNGSANAGPAKNKPAKDNVKDNKVAYLLFYQKI
ncbi:hypothetical protein F4802DRAFT_521112 [Xylaria palmicola]|nr:hypothetical protein F4802DRAFT_521112 [Xylaria palmicola]